MAKDLDIIIVFVIWFLQVTTHELDYTDKKRENGQKKNKTKNSTSNPTASN